jgi:hypothetical protein
MVARAGTPRFEFDPLVTPDGKTHNLEALIVMPFRISSGKA